ncbi:MAG: heavy-metal-associated domain-containing protein [Bdellovibrionales bacterium]|nr:heavy-metal-associated domain-containing protein [Bdellovibrionales bacterium]
MEKKVYFKVDGITCHNCVNKIEQSLSEFTPEVSLDDKSIVMTYEPSELNIKELQEKIEELGYSVLEMRPQ